MGGEKLNLHKPMKHLHTVAFKEVLEKANINYASNHQQLGVDVHGEKTGAPSKSKAKIDWPGSVKRRTGRDNGRSTHTTAVLELFERRIQ